MISEWNILEDILKNQKPIDAQIQSAEQELAALDEKRKALQARIKQLKWQKQSIADKQIPFDRLSQSNVTNDSNVDQAYLPKTQNQMR
jgi:cell division protein FtsB